MNSNNWKAIEDYTFDAPEQIYSFTIRLSYENSWTTKFTKLAILEYKKFMYLASISDEMVSPSEIVDVVWHQHLIFTESYKDFCELLGKEIQHIPSTHQKEEVAIFNKAKLNTTSLYRKHFGEQPSLIWSATNMLDEMKIKEVPHVIFKNKVQIIFWLMITVGGLSFWGSHHFIKQINNPYFLYGVWSIFGGLILLHIGLAFRTGHIISEKLSQSWLIKNLTPLELIYMKYGKMDYVFIQIIDKLIKKKLITTSSKGKLTYQQDSEHLYPIEHIVLNDLKTVQEIKITSLFNHIESKPIGKRIEKSGNVIRKKVLRTTPYFSFQLVILFLYAVLLGSGLCRLYNGIIYNKPTLFLVLSLILFIIVVTIMMKLLDVNFMFEYPICNKLKQEYRGSSQINYVFDDPKGFTSETKRVLKYYKQVKAAKSLSAGYIAIGSSGAGASACGGASCGGASCGGGGCGGCGG